jgi:Ca2+/Na+ antiporter
MMTKIRNILINIYIYIKKAVLIIFSLFYVFMLHLPRFIFILVILIIAFIAFFAQYLNEDEAPEEEQSNSMEQPNLSEQPKPKSKNLLEWSREEDSVENKDINEKALNEKGDVNNKETVTDQAINANIVAFYKNSFIEAYPDSEVFVVPIGMAADLANNIRNKTKESVDGLIRDANDIAYNNANTFPSSPTMSEGEIEHIISMFSSGSQVTVFSPISDSSQATPEKDPNNSPVSVKESPIVEQTKPAVIIVTNRVKEGEPIPLLPSWVNVGFSHEDYHIKKKTLDKMFNRDYVNTLTDHTKPSDRNQEWLNNNDQESFDLDKGLGIDSDEKDDSSKT